MVFLAHRFMPKADLSHYQGREQAYVKHYLLEKYLPDWAYKVGTKWESLGNCSVKRWHFHSLLQTTWWPGSTN